MIIFLYGEDTFRSREKLREVKQDFQRQDKQNLNLTIFQEEMDFRHFQEVARGSPFLAEKRLVILENVFQYSKVTQEKIIQFLEKDKLPSSTILVFWQEGEGDRQSKLFKVLSRKAQQEEFKLFSTWELARWIKNRIKEEERTIEPEASSELILRVGNDLHRLDREITKLLAYRKQEEIELSDVQNLVSPRLETDIFKLVDALSQKNREAALRFISDQLCAGINELYLLGMIIYAFRNLLIVKDLAQKGFGKNKISREAALHPFVVQKTLGCLSRFSLEDLRKIYGKLLDLDIKIKTGEVAPDFGLTMLIMGVTA